MLGFKVNSFIEKTAKPIYFAYRNIHKGKGSDNHHYSLKNKKSGRVEKRGQNFIMRDVTFKISEAGLKRVRDERRKNVHAGVVGSTYTGKKTKGIEWERIKYNPYKNNHFTDQKGKKVTTVNFAKLTPEGVFIPKSVTEKVAYSLTPSVVKNELLPLLFTAKKLSREFTKQMTHGPVSHELGHLAAPKLKELKDKIIEEVVDEGLAPTEAVANIDKVAKELKQQLHGGLADTKTPSDFDSKILKAATKVELEHTTNKEKATEIAMDHIEEHPTYYKELKKMEAKLEKKAGGPGSGVSDDNTAKIDMPLTKHITIMKRTKFMNSKKPFLKNKKIPMSKIKFVGQEKYVPKKLQKFIDAAKKGETWMFDKAIDVTIDKDGNYAVLDGHHRFLIAKHFNKKHIKANIYTVSSKDVTETEIEKVASGGLHSFSHLAPSLAKIPGQIASAFSKGTKNISKGKIVDGAKSAGKGAYNLLAGGRTVNNKWDPLYGAKSIGRTKQQYTSGPLKGMFKYDDAGESIIDLKGKRDWTGFMKDEFSGASRTRGDLMAKVKAKHQGKNVGEYLSTASRSQKNKLQDLNKMKAMDFIKKHPKLAANYYGRNVVQKGLTVGFPAMAAHDVYSGAAENSDPNSSKLSNNLGSLAESAGWALTGPLGLAGATGAVTGIKSGAKALGNLISSPDKVPQIDTNLVQSPGRRAFNQIAQSSRPMLQSIGPMGQYQ